MLNSTITIKVKQRLNKLDSQDYDNITCWQIVESFNKAQVEWSRRQLHGVNVLKEGDEGGGGIVGNACEIVAPDNDSNYLKIKNEKECMSYAAFKSLKI